MVLIKQMKNNTADIKCPGCKRIILKEVAVPCKQCKTLHCKECVKYCKNHDKNLWLVTI